jgi:hypothetical protein
MSVVRGIIIESARYGSGTAVTSRSRFWSRLRVMASSSRWLEPWMSQYSSCTLRFHQVAVHGVGTSHGPLVAITGAPARAPAAIL